MSKTLVIKGADFSGVALDQITYDDPIEPVPCTSITLNQSAITAAAVEDSFQLTATVTPADTTDTLTWASSDENVASVSSNGLVTVHGIGTATITATCGSITATATVTQTSIKAQYPLTSTADHIPGAYTITAVNKQILADSASAAQQTIGQAYHEDNEYLHISGNTTTECVPVPYGATKVLVHTSDGVRVQISYAFLVDTMDLVTFQSAQYPAYISRTTFIKTDVGLDVSYGQGVVFRATDEQTPTLDYVYFE